MLKVAVTGTHGVGKTFIIDNLRKRATEAGITVKVVESPTRYVKSLGFVNNKSLNFETEWMCMALRKERQLSLEQILKANEAQAFAEGWDEEPKQLLLSDRCLLDELSYTAEAIKRIRRGTKSEGWLVPWEQDPAKELADFYEVAQSFVYRDVPVFWDKVWYKAPHPDHLPEADDARIGEREYQLDVDREMRKHFERAESLGMKGVWADKDRNAALEDMWHDIKVTLGV